MTIQMHRNGFAGADLVAAIIATVLFTAVVIPVVAGGRGDAMVEESMNNLKLLGFAHVLYAAEWDGRQITFVKDDISLFGNNVGDYNAAQGCGAANDDPDCHPPVLAGWCEGGLWAYWPAMAGHYWVVEPIGFPGGPGGFEGIGNFRILNASQFNQYANGRFYDSAFYAPADTVPLQLVEPLFDDPCGFAVEGNPPYWISYTMSPAGMFHPDVMRSNAAGGWQDPWDIDHGFAAPGFFEATYPALKTLMIEHHWLQGPPADCNPIFDPGTYDGCEPYYFNHGLESSPVTLFYDLSVRLLPNAEVLAADQQVLKDTGGVDGLWHRGTPFGEDGFFIPQGYDGVPLSHHILTTDGIKGRDTLGEQRPLPIGDFDWPSPIRPYADRDDLKQQRSFASFALMAREENGP